MNDYWLTFRTTGNGSSLRRDRLLSALKAISSDGTWWDEPGSFLIFESDRDIAALRTAVETVIDLDLDFVVIGMLYFLKWEVVGTVENKNLFRSLRYVGVF